MGPNNLVRSGKDPGRGWREWPCRDRFELLSDLSGEMIEVEIVGVVSEWILDLASDFCKPNDDVGSNLKLARLVLVLWVIESGRLRSPSTHHDRRNCNPVETRAVELEGQQQAVYIRNFPNVSVIAPGSWGS